MLVVWALQGRQNRSHADQLTRPRDRIAQLPSRRGELLWRRSLVRGRSRLTPACSGNSGWTSHCVDAGLLMRSLSSFHSRVNTPNLLERLRQHVRWRWAYASSAPLPQCKTSCALLRCHPPPVHRHLLPTGSGRVNRSRPRLRRKTPDPLDGFPSPAVSEARRRGRRPAGPARCRGRIPRGT